MQEKAEDTLRISGPGFGNPEQSGKSDFDSILSGVRQIAQSYNVYLRYYVNIATD
jgi:hypothetical protein